MNWLLDDHFLVDWNLNWDQVWFGNMDDLVDWVWVRFGNLNWVWDMDNLSDGYWLEDWDWMMFNNWNWNSNWVRLGDWHWLGHWNVFSHWDNLLNLHNNRLSMKGEN